MSEREDDARIGRLLSPGPTRHRPFAELRASVRPPPPAPGPAGAPGPPRMPGADTEGGAKLVAAPGKRGRGVPEPPLHTRAAFQPEPQFEIEDEGASFSGWLEGLDRRLLRRLRAGRWRPTARLDLHGMTADQAERVLAPFLLARRNEGHKVVLIICGRGVHSAGGAGVLRGAIGGWLARGPASRHVLCFTAARPEQGGDGALYVMLRS